MQKIGQAEVEKIVSKETLEKLGSTEKTEKLRKIFVGLENAGFEEGRDFVFYPYLARGLDYYTSTIFELKLNKLGELSIGGGGRYDNLIGVFAGRDIPAVGFSFGIDRIIDLI